VYLADISSIPERGISSVAPAPDTATTQTGRDSHNMLDFEANFRGIRCCELTPDSHKFNYKNCGRKTIQSSEDFLKCTAVEENKQKHFG